MTMTRITLARLFTTQSLVLLALAGAVSMVVMTGERNTLAAFTAATANDNSTLSAVNFAISASASGSVGNASALFSITDAQPDDWVQKNITITPTVGASGATLALQLSAATVGGIVSPLTDAAPSNKGMRIRVESCTANTFAQAGCTGVSGLNGGVTAGVADGGGITTAAANFVRYADVTTPVNLNTSITSATPLYYKVFMKFPSGISGVSGDNALIGLTGGTKWAFSLTSNAGTVRNTP